MKFMAVLAFVIVAIDCAEKALGIQPQALFSDSAQWAWWIVAASWALGAVAMMFYRVEH